VAGPWRVSYDENGGYDCMTSSFDVLKMAEGPYGPVVLQVIALDMGDYGEHAAWDAGPPVPLWGLELVKIAQQENLSARYVTGGF
jgi:hypothetical protein